ncbi:MAG: hypothetical protein U5R31_01815 [Acidimicrobiia bacterium]|nr:hypothetical protein [Acidimicrobiia bacterium]
MAVAGPALPRLDWELAVYAVLSLTVVRMVPIALSLLGAGLKTETVLLLGWFGPRGLASIVFGLMVIDEARPRGRRPALSRGDLDRPPEHRRSRNDGSTARHLVRPALRRPGRRARRSMPESVEVRDLPTRYPGPDATGRG